ncbi:uncharacterized protein JCM6883_006015 [Sporobolomyces salmoneus]|uniref:uncharacterized protein n=1 Tax=Sporobolomyces salmoneus TaxID=183962 RepID=UPI0031804B17
MRRSSSIARKASKYSLQPLASRPRLPPGSNSSFNLASPCLRVGSRRTFFGLGEVMGVLSNPAETLRSLSDAKRQLQEMQQELKDAKERSQIPASHTFSPLPGFFDRPNEIKAIERALGSVPAFTVLFGSSSVGKTALLRQVLSDSDKYHVLHFDLRIAGFADLASLYFSLSQQLESYFAVIPEQLGAEWGWDEFEKESWAFKHDRLEVEKRVKDGGDVKTADVSRLMEILQSSLLAYWDFEPMSKAQRKEMEEAKEKADKEDDKPTKSTKVETTAASNMLNDPTEARMRLGAVPKPETTEKSKQTLLEARSLGDEQKTDEKGEKKENEVEGKEEERKPRSKKIPVIFIDEAHKLPALIRADDAMKAILDSLLVLTKQDRLAHTLLATSDSFFMTWLRAWNTAQHCQILSIGDCSKAEAKRFFEEVLVPHVPEKYRSKYNFEDLFRVFGGKLAHLSDFTGEFVNSEGELSMLHSSHFLQAHALLNLQLIHARPPPSKSGEEAEASTGFRIYSPLQGSSPAGTGSPTESDSADFTVQDLLKVMNRLEPGKQEALPYFALCRELGAQAVDGMVRGRILELRWSSTVTDEGEPRSVLETEKEKVVGPVVVPTTPVIKYAMGKVLEEWKDELKQ